MKFLNLLNWSGETKSIEAVELRSSARLESSTDGLREFLPPFIERDFEIVFHVDQWIFVLAITSGRRAW